MPSAKTCKGMSLPPWIPAANTYDAWGKVLSVTDANGNANTSSTFIGNVNPIRYRGYYYDKETGWYYLNSRYYDPEVKRFINADSEITTGAEIAGTNLFSYCANNPVNAVDPEGNMFMFLTAAIGAVAGAVIGGVVAASQGENIWAGAAVGAAAGGLVGLGAGAATGALLAGSVTATTSAVVTGGAVLANTVATGGATAGISYIANNLHQASTQITNTVATTTQKIISKAPSNPGRAFEPGKTGFQYGVDPNTLTPIKDLSKLDPQRMADAIKYGGDHAVRVGRTGIIQDGHHRVADAIVNGRAIDIFVEAYK